MHRVDGGDGFACERVIQVEEDGIVLVERAQRPPIGDDRRRAARLDDLHRRVDAEQAQLVFEVDMQRLGSGQGCVGRRVKLQPAGLGCADKEDGRDNDGYIQDSAAIPCAASLLWGRLCAADRVETMVVVAIRPSHANVGAPRQPVVGACRRR